MLSILILSNFALCQAVNKFITSIPKCGTHLIMRGLHLCNLTSVRYSKPEAFGNLSNDSFIFEHFMPNEETIQMLKKHDSKGIFILRDPRDWVVSFAHWKKQNPQVWPQYIGVKLEQVMTDIIEKNFAYFCSFLPFMEQPFIYTTRFEKLVGENGGGTLEDQILEINAITKHLGIVLNGNKKMDICRNIYGHTATFREGKIGSWKNAFSPEQKKRCKEIWGQLLIELGYEKDLNW